MTLAVSLISGGALSDSVSISTFVLHVDMGIEEALTTQG